MVEVSPGVFRQAVILGYLMGAFRPDMKWLSGPWEPKSAIF